MSEKAAETVQNAAAVEAMLTEIRARSINIERKINILLRNEIPLGNFIEVASDEGDKHYGSKTYAQHGDDLIILNIFWMINIKKPSYIDIGAHDPFKISNTALLYLRGSRGVNVEANPLLIKAFHTQRPEDINLNVAVSDQEGEMTYYMFDDRSGLNTLDPKRAAELEKAGRFKVQRTIPVPAMTVSQIIDKHCGGTFPDLLSLDVEGLDGSVLRSIDYAKSYPKVICVEGNHPEERRDYVEFLTTKGYSLYFRAVSNLFFIRTEYLDALIS